MMNKPNSIKNTRKKRDGVDCHKNREFVVEPTLYSSVIQTEWNLRNITHSHLPPKPIVNKAIISTREVNFPFKDQMYDYSSMVDVGLNSGIKTLRKPKSQEVQSIKQPEPKLSDYFQPSFDNVQRIQMKSVKTSPELTVQYDGLAVTRILNEVDDLVFK
ncbi:Hypothetical protein CINCED_3A018857 [Cinara cedri]|uniref:Uncharacterized protein n=1 Tax=Cinara cedri TaxID=506608 RepID=A0A5E4NPI5_9HEMI|nr:Hypothetical protein CINCED_3A018857 [Cinara cedri]